MKLKVCCMCVYLYLGVQAGFSQAFYDKIQQQQEASAITEIQALYLKALRSFFPEKLPEEYRQLFSLPLKSATVLLAQIKNRWNEFTPQQKSILESLFYRPNLDAYYISPGGFFRIHYDTLGINAVSMDDFDGSGVPDYVEEVADSYEYVYSVEVGQMGYNPPPDDNNEDGQEWDVYIKNISDYGFTNYVTDPRNPNRWITYITMDNDYTHTGTVGMDAARVTAAHEFFHMIQFGYYFRSDDIFLMEAASTWMEDVVYDYVNDYYYYLPGFFRDTNVAFDYGYGLHMYGLCIWFHFLEKHLGTRDIVRLVWEQLRYYPALQALDGALQGMNQNFEEALALFNGWNYMTGSRADTVLFYPEGDAYPEMEIDGSFVLRQDTSLILQVSPKAARYFQFSLEDGTMLTFIPTNVNLTSDQTSGECTLEIIHGESRPYYTSLGNNILTRISSDDDIPWKCVAVVESPGQETVFMPFGEFGSEFDGSISGMVWKDVNGNGVPGDVGEEGMSGISIRLIEAGVDSILGTSDDIPFSTKQTNENGSYAFYNLYPGLYLVDPDESTVSSEFILTTFNDPLRIQLDEDEKYWGANFGYRPLEQNNLPAAIPNPYVAGEYPITEIQIPFNADEAGIVSITIFSTSGFKVLEEEIEIQSSGVQTFSWDLKDQDDDPVPGGVYVYLVTSDGRLIRREKMALVR